MPVDRFSRVAWRTRRDARAEPLNHPPEHNAVHGSSESQWARQDSNLGFVSGTIREAETSASETAHIGTYALPVVGWGVCRWVLLDVSLEVRDGCGGDRADGAS